MHVNAAARLSLAILVVCSACDAPSTKPSSDAKVVAPSAASAAPKISVADEAFVALARSARDAATAVASSCRFRYDSFSDSPMYDDCTWTPAKLATLRDAATALQVSSLRDSGALPADAATFAFHLRLFAEWVELARELPKRGTLRHYQELARTWNAWRPTEKIAIDPVPPMTRYGEPKWDGGALAWEQCPFGACLKDKDAGPPK